MHVMSAWSAVATMMGRKLRDVWCTASVAIE
jgi:hypothetical protein